MKDVKRDKCVHKWTEISIIRTLTVCCCAGSGDEGVVEDIKRDKGIQVWMETCLMKSTKVQTLGAYCMSCSSSAYYANARARKLATPRVVAVTRGAVSSRPNMG